MSFDKSKGMLRVTSGPDRGRTFILKDRLKLIIGRGRDSDTEIHDPRLSRVHCEINWTAGNWTLIDRGGSGGTKVDGHGVTSTQTLSNGSVIQIGGSELILQEDDHWESAQTIPSETMNRSPPQQNNLSLITELEGEIFLRFRLDKLISRGANSVMFKGLDLKHNRPMAVKILNPQMTSSDRQRERFIRAMRTMLPIKHPHIVRTRKAGQTGDYCWAAFDWVDGVSVAELIESYGIGGMLEWKEVWRVAVHIGRALQEASKQMIVHRNVTPSNLLRRADDHAFLLTDLIFARALEYTDAQQLTRPGELVGDLGYIAPERLLDSRCVDERSDQYSLGATLYALLTGKPPYEALGVVDLLEKLRTQDPPSPASFQIGLDERFCDVVMKMIQKTPTARYPSPAALLRDLERSGKLAGIEADWDDWK